MFRQENLLLSIMNEDRIVFLLHFQERTLALDQSAVVEIVAHALDQWFKGYEVQNDSSPIQLAIHPNRHLIIMAMQRLSPAVSEDKKMRGSKIEIIFSNFNGKNARHEADVSQKARMIQDCRPRENLNFIKSVNNTCNQTRDGLPEER